MNRPSNEPFVAVILLTVDQRDVTLRCLESLTTVERPDHAVVVWDNGSEDGTREAIEREFPTVTRGRSPVNLGAAAGRNAAARLAIERFDPTHLLFLDNDTVVTADLVERLVEPTRTHPDVAQTVPKIRLLDDPERLDMAGGARIRYRVGDTTGLGRGETDRGQYDDPFDCVGGGCTLVTVDAFRRVGGFDVAFDPYGYEDMDLSLRLREAGFRCRYVPEAVLYHQVTQTLEGGRYTWRYAGIKARNWIRFMNRHATLSQKVGFWTLGVPYLVGRRLLGRGRRPRRKGA